MDPRLASNLFGTLATGAICHGSRTCCWREAVWPWALRTPGETSGYMARWRCLENTCSWRWELCWSNFSVGYGSFFGPNWFSGPWVDIHECKLLSYSGLKASWSRMIKDYSGLVISGLVSILPNMGMRAVHDHKLCCRYLIHHCYLQKSTTVHVKGKQV